MPKILKSAGVIPKHKRQCGFKYTEKGYKIFNIVVLTLISVIYFAFFITGNFSILIGHAW